MKNETYRAMTKALEEAGCPDAAFDAAELYRFVVGKDPRLASEPDAGQRGRLAKLTARRAAREPLQYILGEWDFLDFTLKVGPGVLCPRADSEVVCEAAIECLKDNSDAVAIDLCAGSGCLGLGIARNCQGSRVECVEKSEEAYRYLEGNVRALGRGRVTAVLADAFEYCALQRENSADLIISNPPYLTAGEMDVLMPETAHEPAMALAGGEDGLTFYRRLIDETARILKPNGWLVLEIGCAQRAAVLALAAANPAWERAEARKDLGGNDRVILLQKTQKNRGNP